MTENEAIKWLKAWSATHQNENDNIRESVWLAIKALEEIQQYRVYKEIFESHFSKDALELLSDKEEFGKWLERGKWIAKKCDEINRKLESFEAIGTIGEFKALKEKNEPIANGEWIDTQPGYNNGYYKNVRVCSNCHDYYTTEYDEMKFCPKCGAKMTES